MSENLRDKIAEAASRHLPQSRGAGRWPGCHSHPTVMDYTPEHVADVVLAVLAPELAEVERLRAVLANVEALAEAWDEKRRPGMIGISRRIRAALASVPEPSESEDQ